MCSAWRNSFKPDAQKATAFVSTAADPAHFQTLPRIDINEVVGICEVVHEYGGCVDFHDLAREFGSLRLMPLAIEGARMLGLIKMRNGEVALSPLGRTWIQGDAQERQRMLHDPIASLELIRWLCTLLRSSGSRAISAGDLLGPGPQALPRRQIPAFLRSPRFMGVADSSGRSWQLSFS